MTTVLGVPRISSELMVDLDRVGRKYPRWTVQAYFELSGNYLVEYCRGRLEILPMPNMRHQVIASRLYDALRAAAPPGGYVLFAGTRVRVADELFREPDVLYIPTEWRSAVHEEFTERAAIVMEVVSESNREHDLETKRAEYARAGIPEYWIVDPEERRILVLKLADVGVYVPHGEFREGQRAASALLPKLQVDVTEVFAADQADQ